MLDYVTAYHFDVMIQYVTEKNTETPTMIIS